LYQFDVLKHSLIGPTHQERWTPSLIG